MSDSSKIDLKEVNKTKKSFKLPKLSNPFIKQKGLKRDEEGKFASTTGGGGLKSVKSINFKRAIPLVAVVVIVGSSFVYQSFAAACSITADKTSIYEGESTTIRWKSPVVPVVIDGGNMGSVKEGQWGSGNLNATKTFKLVGGWDSSCTDSVTVIVKKRPTATSSTTVNQAPAPANPATPAPVGSTALTDADAKFKWTDSQVKISRQNRDEARSIAAQSKVSRAQLDSIAPLEKWVRDAVNQSTPFIGQVQTAYNQAKTAKKSQDEQNKLLYYAGAINNNVQEMMSIITEISNSYSTARQKYESAQNFQTGGGGGSGAQDKVGTTQAPVPAGLTQQQRVDWARNYCNNQPDYTDTRSITGGQRGEIRELYHSGSNTYCNNRLVRVTWIKCDSGYRVSENAAGTIKTCVKNTPKAESAKKSYPAPPYPYCAKKTHPRCITSFKRVNTSNASLITEFTSCSRRWYGFRSVGKTSDSHCESQTGEWDFMKLRFL